MAHARFDPTHSVRFDLGRGQLKVDGRENRLLVPSDALLGLWAEASDEAKKNFGQRLGTEIGRRAAGRLGSVEAASIPAMVEHLGGDIALCGLGSLSVERWGKALVLRVDGSPLGAEGDALLAAVLEGALHRAMGRDVAAVRLDRDDQRVRFLVVSPGAASRVRGWLAEGKPWGQVLTTLDGAGAPGAE